jgi:hypothetical protein
MENINALMQAVNCTKWPERWNSLFDAAVKKYEELGCPLADSDHYVQLEEKYHMFGEVLEAYIICADKIKGDKAFELFLVLASMALEKRDGIRAELNEFVRPVSPDNADDIKYDMLPGLIICSMTEYSFNKMKGLGLENDKIFGALSLFAKNGVKGFMLRHNGNYGYDLLNWFQLAVDGELFPLDHLQIQVNVKYNCDAHVFKNENGEITALALPQRVHRSGHVLGARFCEDEEGAFDADYTETDQAYIGHPLDENGLILKETVALSKNEWKIALQKGDFVASIHLPRNASITKEDTDKFFADTKEFLRKYFPDYDYKAIVCGSWLIDPALKEILKPTSNIIDFQERFKKVQVKSRGEGVFKFVFNKADMNFNLEELEETTSLQRAVKERYLNGKAIYEVMGYVIK